MAITPVSTRIVKYFLVIGFADKTRRRKKHNAVATAEPQTTDIVYRYPFVTGRDKFVELIDSRGSPSLKHNTEGICSICFRDV